MPGPMRFEGRVAVITGAGGGLGRSYARLLAARGARVVVNDLGTDLHGGGSSVSAANLVAEEIRSAGGEAVANHESVEHGERIIECALDHFGRVDAVINNAGILRDRAFHNMTRDDWDAVYRVHVLGAFEVTRAAWPGMRERRSGRIVFTSSAAGIFGNFGQANYSMAKLGVHGLCQTLAVEGARYGIKANSVSPSGWTRMTQTLTDEAIGRFLDPEAVSPLVAYLCHDDCAVSGAMFACGGGWITRLRWQQAAGKSFGETHTPEDIAASLEEIGDFSKATAPSNIAEAVGPIVARIQARADGQRQP